MELLIQQILFASLGLAHGALIEYLKKKGYILAARINAVFFYVLGAALLIILGLWPLLIFFLIFFVVLVHGDLWFGQNKKTDSGNTDGNTG